MTKPELITITITGLNGRFNLSLEIDGEEIHHHRTQAGYASPSDAITSSRHLVNEILKPSTPKKK